MRGHKFRESLGPLGHIYGPATGLLKHIIYLYAVEHLFVHSKYVLTDSNVLLTLLPSHLFNTVSNVL